MNTTTLRYFLEVARVGSVRGAAGRLNITASAISRHMSNLEHDVGSPLFERRVSGMVLTTEGETFRQHAHRIIRDIDLAQSDIDEIRSLRRGVVKVSAVEGVIGVCVFAAIEEFRAKHPGVVFEVMVVGTHDVINALKNDTCDLGIAFEPPRHSEIQHVVGVEKAIVAVMAPDHPFADRKQFSVRDLQKMTLGSLDASFGTRRLVDRAARTAGIELSYALVINSIAMVKLFARDHHGVTVLPAFAVTRECEKGELVTVPLTDRVLRQARVTLSVHRGRTLSRAAQAFRRSLEARIDSL